ncbi:caspase family protein [Marinobacter alexandrii]|jgi:WD40 repeat protein|uniref:caspase family protein n=1 Tax=Marinobacter alexandrii TaxID=2570351 RepID=UPI002ABD5E08|nr:caspase family protein [Marinobacter alexandrii]
MGRTVNLENIGSKDTSDYRGRALLVAVGNYKYPTYAQLKVAPKAAKHLAQSLQDGGYRLEYSQLLAGGEKADIAHHVRQWFREADADDTLFFFWTGHGVSDAEGHYLITYETPHMSLDGEVAFAASTLGTMVAKSPADKILVVLDTCYSGAGAADIAKSIATVLATRIPIPGRSRSVAVIASAHPLQKAQEGRLSTVLTEILTTPLAPRPWSDNDQYIHTNLLAEALEKILDNPLGYKADGAQQGFIPNPRYFGALPPEDIETRRKQLAISETEQSFLSVSRGIELDAMDGCLFTGRQRLLRVLVDWMASERRGMTILTGPPGAGKSAVLGHLLALSDSENRDKALQNQNFQCRRGVPPPKGIDVAIYARNKTLSDCIGGLANGLKIDLSGKDQFSQETIHALRALLEKIRIIGSKRRLTFLIDGLDEARRGHAIAIGARLLKPLSEIPKVGVLVGVRRNPEGRILADTEDRHKELRVLFGDETIIHDIEDETDTYLDMVNYISRRLLSSKHQYRGTRQIESAANTVAMQANGIFLYARIVSRTLMDSDQLDEPLPDSALSAFVADLTYRFEANQVQVHDMLRALAWSEGKGLTRQVWPLIASALSPDGAVYSDNDVSWVLGNAGAHIIEHGENGQAVFQLEHQVFLDYFRKQNDEQSANILIFEALTKDVSGANWLVTDGYISRHLASHAQIAGALPELLRDPGYLVVADPTGLRRAMRGMPPINKSPERQFAQIYSRTTGRLIGADPIARMPLLHLTACMDEPSMANFFEPLVQTRWRCRWAKCSRICPELVLHHNSVVSLAWGSIDGVSILVSGGKDCTARLWYASTGEPFGNPLCHKDSVVSVAWGEIDGEPMVFTACRNSVMSWCARTGKSSGSPLVHDTGVSHLVWCNNEGDAVLVAACNDGTIQRWNARTGEPVGSPLKQKGSIAGLAWVEIEGESILVSAFNTTAPAHEGIGKKGIVQFWYAKTGMPFGSPVEVDDYIVAVDVGIVDDEPVVAYVFGAIMRRSLRLLDARTRSHLFEPVECERGTVEFPSIGFGQVEGEPVVISGGEEGIVRLWNARTGKKEQELSWEYLARVTAVKLCEINGEPLTVAANTHGLVRLSYFLPGYRNYDRSQPEKVNKLIWGEIEGEPVIVTANSNGDVQLLSHLNGAPLSNPIPHEKYKVSVAWGEINGHPMLVTACRQLVRIWSAITGELWTAPLQCDEEVHHVAWGEIDGEPVVLLRSWGAKAVNFWNVRTGKFWSMPIYRDTWVSTIVWGKIGGEPILISSGYGSQSVQIWDARTGKLRSQTVCHDDFVHILAFGQVDGNPILASGERDIVRLWNTRTGEPYRELLHDEEWVTELILIELESVPILLTGSAQGTLRFWDVHTGRLKLNIKLDTQIESLDIKNGNVVAIATYRGVLVIDINTI